MSAFVIYSRELPTFYIGGQSDGNRYNIHAGGEDEITILAGNSHVWWKNI
ncbi:hypothetical protein SAMN05421852_10453 [Thermoflavimicrobium dichotomicum]|uniref:Uncharacterized protein n=1 Tax=Thermoflavimicrobium dichotomicum TaxID=46223 RepID=A0A1I3N9E2_9BACL|nr:hypothetical protein SAMN05421852_10453 [Thermoflavimicrobium dichotomicum]